MASRRILTMRQRRQLLYAVMGLVVAGITLFGQRQGWIEEKKTDKPTDTPNTQIQVSNVKSFEDGDTITVEVNGVSEKVRLIGVDTPETRDPRVSVQCFGKAASEFTKSLIGTQSVRLESDQTNSDRDKYNRLLRYVYLPDNKMVNAEIIRQGYGFAYTLYPFEKMEEFKRLEKEARENNIGLWSTCSINQDGDKKTTNPAS